MRPDFFQHQMERLRKVYSPSSLNEERIKVLWDSFHGVPDSQFEKALDYLIGEFTTQALPAVSRFREAVAANRSSDGGGASSMQELPSPHDCERCADSGWIANGYNRRTGQGTIVACSCAPGRRLNPSELVEIQRKFDNGAKFMNRLLGSVLKELPYDPSERIGGDP